MNKVHKYKDHTITLEAERRESGWVCKFSVIPFDPQNTCSHSAYTTLYCDTEEKAELLALGTAIHWLDASLSP